MRRRVARVRRESAPLLPRHRLWLALVLALTAGCPGWTKVFTDDQGHPNVLHPNPHGVFNPDPLAPSCRP